MTTATLSPAEVSDNPATATDATMEPDDTGSIAYVTARLTRWAKIAPQGMAVVTFESPLARQAVLDNLAANLRREDIAFTSVELEAQRPALEHVKRLAVDVLPKESGVVSVTGFQHAFTDEEGVSEALRFLNYNRENLVNLPVKQIWWMPSDLAALFENVAPELARYFLVWMRLSEVIRSETSAIQYDALPEGPLLGAEEAKRLSDYHRKRFQQAMSEQRSLTEMMHLCIKTFAPLTEAGLLRQAEHEQQTLFAELRCAGYNVDAYLAEEIPSASTQQDARNYNELGLFYRYQGRLDKAESTLRHCLRLFDDLQIPQDVDYLTVQGNLAAVLEARGKLEDSVMMYQDVLTKTERILGPLHIETARYLNGLATSLAHNGKTSEAESLQRRALNVCLQLFGKVNAEAAICMSNLASYLCEQGKMDESERFARQALHVRTQLFGSKHHSVAIGMNTLAGILSEKREYSNAEQLLRQSVNILEQTSSSNYTWLGLALNNLGVCLHEQKKYREAEFVQRRAVEIAEKVLGADHRDVVKYRRNYNAFADFLKKNPQLAKPLQPMQRKPKAKK